MTQGMIEVSARGNPGSQDCVTFGESLDLSEPVSSSGKWGEEQSLFLRMTQQDMHKSWGFGAL